MRSPVFSRSGRTLRYQGREFQSLDGGGFKANYFDCASGEHYWISGCKKLGGNRLYPGTIEIDEDVREKYWTEIRGLPQNNNLRIIRSGGKYGGKAKQAK